MTKRVHPIIAVLALIIALVLVAMVFSRRMQEPPRQTAPMMGRRGAGRGGGMAMRRGGGGGGTSQSSALGIRFSQSSSPRGFKVDGFEGSAGSSPLEVIGVKPGDVIMECNGAKQGIRDALITAIDELQTGGKPITVVVSRGGKELSLKRTEKLPAAAVAKTKAPASSQGKAKPAASPGKGEGKPPE
jgi:membrane-associated protease RseP (regulator of RpoE activity)